MRFCLLAILFALSIPGLAEPIATVDAHVNESRIPWRFTLTSQPAFSNYHYEIRIVDSVSQELIQKIEIRNGVELSKDDFQVGGFFPDGLACIRVVGGESAGVTWFKTWKLDPATGKFVFVVEP